MGINPRNLPYRPGSSYAASLGLGIAVVAAWAFGKYCDRMESNRRVMFRDKSKMFGGKVEEGQPPSWGSDYWSFCRKSV